MSEIIAGVTASSYLRGILAREAVAIGMRSPFRLLEPEIEGVCRRWAGRTLLEVYPTGAFEKGFANRSGVVIDFLVSLAPDSHYVLADAYDGLCAALADEGLSPVRRSVSIAVTLRGWSVDIIPARRVGPNTDEHAVFLTRTGRPTVTNLTQHVLDGIACGRRDEIRLIKLWRDQRGLDFPSFYLELAVIAALRRRAAADLADNVWTVFGYLEALFAARSQLDPANANNIVSDQLTPAQKDAVRRAAQYARAGRSWHDIIR